MKLRFLLLPVALLANHAYSQTVANCPQLPAASDLHWNYQAGPDFDVCYAVRGTDNAQAFGIYLGMAPSFRARPGNIAETGKVSSYKVRWYKKEPSDAAFPYARETVISLGRNRGKAHIWFNAATPAESLQVQSLLQLLIFK